MLNPSPMYVVPSLHKHRIETGLFNVAALLDSANARDRLRALNHLQILVRNEVDLAVREAREMKMSWRDIGDVFGLSRQSAHERWGTDDDNIQYVSTDAVPMDDCTRGAIFRVFDGEGKWLMSVIVHMSRSLEATGAAFHELPARAMRLVRRYVLDAQWVEENRGRTDARLIIGTGGVWDSLAG
jgi:hypothetical protein